LIVITLQTSPAQYIQQIELRFYLAGGSSSYYSRLHLSRVLSRRHLWNRDGLSGNRKPDSPATRSADYRANPRDDSGSVAAIHAVYGSGHMEACLHSRGNFFPVGQAGEQSLDWANVTGWELTHHDQQRGRLIFAVNGLYLQWGYGPSSSQEWATTTGKPTTTRNTGTGIVALPDPEIRPILRYLASQAAPIFLRQAAR